MLYTSKYPELGFYVNGARRQFSGGSYRTDDPEEMAVLDRITDAKRAESIEVEAHDPEVPADSAPESTPEPAEQPAVIAKPARKPAKASAK